MYMKKMSWWGQTSQRSLDRLQQGIRVTCLAHHTAIYMYIASTYTCTCISLQMYMYMYECICYMYMFMYMYVFHKCVLGCCGTTTKHTVYHVVPIPYHPGFSSSQHFVRLFSPLFLSSFFFQEGHTVMYILYMYMVMYNVYASCIQSVTCIYSTSAISPY